jgi:hypothetical protein
MPVEPEKKCISFGDEMEANVRGVSFCLITMKCLAMLLSGVDEERR